MTIREKLDQLNVMYTKMKNEDQLLKEYNKLNLELKPLEIKLKRIENEHNEIELKLKQLKKFRLFNLFKNDHGARALRISSCQQNYNESYKTLKHCSNRFHELTSQKEEIKAKLIELNQLKHDYEQLVTDIINESKQDQSNLLEKLNLTTNQTIKNLDKFETILEHGYLLRQKLLMIRRQIFSSKKVAELDLYDLPFTGLLKVAGSAIYNQNLSEFYEHAADFNALIKPYEMRLRINLGGTSSLADTLMDNRYMDRRSIKQVNSNLAPWKKTFNDLTVILETVTTQFHTAKEELETLLEERHNKVMALL